MSTDDKFLENMRKLHNTKEKDKIVLTTQSMESILKNIVQVPEKLHMTGSPDKPSVKSSKSGENQLHTGAGKDMFDSTMAR